MVKFRGIEVSIISQFDIRRLPEFHPPATLDPFSIAGPRLHTPQTCTASCYIPTYPGSQIWFEYAVDGPHPLNAIYYFKLSHNGITVTSWDCTGKNGYHGKMCYALDVTTLAGTDSTLTPVVSRLGMRFGNESEEQSKVKGPWDDCLEVTVHRVEYRQRVQVLSSEGVAPLQALERRDSNFARLCFIDGGVLEAGHPRRRYKYQLIDALDEPYATFRFFYRSYEYLQDHSIVNSNFTTSSLCSTSSIDEHETASPETQSVNSPLRPKPAMIKEDEPARLTTFSETRLTPPGTPRFHRPNPAKTEATSKMDKKQFSVITYPRSNSEESLRLVTKDSIEDLHSPVPRSPKSSRQYGKENDKGPSCKVLPNSNISQSPTRCSDTSPAELSNVRLQEANLTVVIDGAEFDLGRDKCRRPLSPFTGSGILRRMKAFGPPPPSAPAAVTEFGPSIWDEVAEKLATERLLEAAPKDRKTTDEGFRSGRGAERTTRAQRGGKALMGFLGRRNASGKAYKLD